MQYKSTRQYRVWIDKRTYCGVEISFSIKADNHSTLSIQLQISMSCADPEILSERVQI